jgi:hypothetical protein
VGVEAAGAASTEREVFVAPSLYVQMGVTGERGAARLGLGQLAFTATPGVTLRAPRWGAWRASLQLGVEVESSVRSTGRVATHLMPLARVGAVYQGREASPDADTLSGLFPALFPDLHAYALFGARASRPMQYETLRAGVGVSSPYLPGMGAMLAGLPSNLELLVETSARDTTAWVRWGLGF